MTFYPGAPATDVRSIKLELDLPLAVYLLMLLPVTVALGATGIYYALKFANRFLRKRMLFVPVVTMAGLIKSDDQQRLTDEDEEASTNYSNDGVLNVEVIDECAQEGDSSKQVMDADFGRPSILALSSPSGSFLSLKTMKSPQVSLKSHLLDSDISESSGSSDCDCALPGDANGEDLLCTDKAVTESTPAKKTPPSPMELKSSKLIEEKDDPSMPITKALPETPEGNAAVYNDEVVTEDEAADYTDESFQDSRP